MSEPRITINAPRCRCAFTLLELLVVIAVIAILASLLLPALEAAKSSVHSAKCKGNVRQIGIGLQLYTGDHGAFPFASVIVINQSFTVENVAEARRRHRSNCNMFLLDGHVEAARLTHLWAEDVTSLRRWNNDNEAHRELLRPWGGVLAGQP